MYQNIIFIGGIHGVGKGTACKEIQKKLMLEHLSASEVLKWSEISPKAHNKFVKNISETQERLIRGLQNSIAPNKKYILDGHFCLFDSNGIVSPVPVETFKLISPILISIVTCNPSIISERLENRDGKKYNVQIIDEMQKAEVNHGQLVASKLKIPFIEISDDLSPLIELIKTS